MSDPVQIGDATLRWTGIYALCEWPSGAPRYVGKTVQHLVDRRKAHIRDAKRPRLPVHFWLRKRLASGQGFLTKLIEHVPPGGDWAARERYWIAQYRAQGADLLNLTAGGEGLAGHRFSKQHKAKIAAALRTGATLACAECGASFWRKANQIRRGHAKFCSRACSNRFNRGGHRNA